MKKVRKAAEDYLEAMLMLSEEKGFIRSLDVAELLGVTKPSVSYAVKHLREDGFITMDENSLITLTLSGMEIAERMYTRHKLLTEFLVHLGVEESVAREDACKMEHDMSQQTFEAICRCWESNRLNGGR